MAISFPVLNYAASAPQVDLSRSLIGGIGDAIQIKAAQAEAEARDAQAMAQRAAAERAAAYQDAVQAYLADPTPDGALQLMTLNPDGAEGIRKAWEGRQAEVRMTDFRDTAEAMSLLRAGKPDAALALAQRRVDAEVKAGRDPSEEQAVVDLIRDDPVKAFGVLQYTLGSIMEAQKPGSFAETMKTFGEDRRAEELQPWAVRKGNAEAISAEVEAKYAAPKAEADIANTRSQIADRQARTSIEAFKARIEDRRARAYEAWRASGSTSGRGARLPTAAIDKLTTSAETTQEIADLLKTFDPKFSGVGSRVGNFAGRMGVGSEQQGKQADWWQRMEAADNIVRNQLFGASLTVGEQQAWERTTVTPNMSPERVKARLAQREKILRRALDRSAQTYRANGYNVDAIGAATRITDAPTTGDGKKLTQKQQQLASKFGVEF